MLSSKTIAQRIIGQLEDIGIKSKVGNENSHTAKLVEIIVREIITAIQTDAEVSTMVQVTTQGTPTMHTGTGSGVGNVK